MKTSLEMQIAVGIITMLAAITAAFFVTNPWIKWPLAATLILAGCLAELYMERARKQHAGQSR